MDIKTILDYWAKHVEYDPDQTQFNLFSSNFEFNRCGKTMKMIMEEYDPSGLLSVMYAKLRYKEILKQCSVKLFDLIEQPESLDEYKRMWELFCSSRIVAAEDALIRKFNSMLSKIEGCPLIGAEDKEDSLKRIYDAIGDVCESLNKCHLEVYCKGNNAVKIDSICTEINVFDTLAETLLALEQAQDMAYICYIRQYQSAAGYFGIFIKSNGTILSVNDRVNEKYIGQHQNSRNGRWQEEKKDELFPYDKIIEDVKGKDYKGYPISFVVSKEYIPLKDIGAESYIHLLLAISLLENKINRFNPATQELTYTNAMLPNSVLLSDFVTSDETHLIQIDRSLIVSEHQQIHLAFSDKEVITGSASAKFDRDANPNKDAGRYKNRNQKLVELYAEGFHVDPTAFAKYDRSKLLVDGTTEVVISEFVGSQYKMEAQAYRDSRAQLAEYIKIGMERELEAFGGTKNVDKWFEELIERKKDVLIRKASELYYDICITKTRKNTEFSPFSLSCSKDVQVSVIRGNYPPGKFTAMNAPMNLKYGFATKYVCPITGTTANVWVLISPQTAENLETFFEESPLPKIIQGWFLTDSIFEYGGNSILENVDPVGEMNHILTYQNYGPSAFNKSFYFAVGFSKQGLNKIVKQLKKGRKDNILKGEE